MNNRLDQNHFHARVEANFARVLDRIAAAAYSVGRDADEVSLVVVTKGHPLDTVQAAVNAGARILGENYVEEALPKMKVISDHREIAWHMIGHIQSRKARSVAENFDFVHSLDSVKLARRLHRFSEGRGSSLPVLLELNVSGEESKYGWRAWDDEHMEELFDDVEEVLRFSNLSVRGLMTLAPFLSDPEGARPFFKRLRYMRERLVENYPQTDWHELSMGMSADFEVAIQEGATIVRIGTAILGERP